MFWPFKRKSKEEDAIWRDWNPELPPAKDLSERVRRRIEREYREACHQSELDTVLNRAFRTSESVPPPTGFVALWRNQYFQVGFAMACMGLGVLLAEWRLAQYWRAHSQDLADRYVRLLTPDLSEAEANATLSKNSELPDGKREEARP